MPKKKARASTAEQKKTKGIRFDNEPELLAAIEKDAKAEGRNFSQHVKYILRKHLERK